MLNKHPFRYLSVRQSNFLITPVIFSDFSFCLFQKEKNTMGRWRQIRRHLDLSTEGNVVSDNSSPALAKLWQMFFASFFHRHYLVSFLAIFYIWHMYRRITGLYLSPGIYSDNFAEKFRILRWCSHSGRLRSGLFLNFQKIRFKSTR